MDLHADIETLTGWLTVFRLQSIDAKDGGDCKSRLLAMFVHANQKKVQLGRIDNVKPKILYVFFKFLWVLLKYLVSITYTVYGILFTVNSICWKWDGCHEQPNQEFCSGNKNFRTIKNLSTIYPGTSEIIFEQINGFENDVIYNQTIARDGLYHFIKVKNLNSWFLITYHFR